MKKYKIWSLTILVLLATMIIACGGDDDNNNSSSNSGNIKTQLVGIWKTSMSNTNWKFIKLETNGTLLFSRSSKELKEIINNPSVNSTKAFWSYNGSDNTISMYTDGGSYAFTYKVNMAADGKSWAGYDTSNSSKTYSFVKIDNLDDYEDEQTIPDYQGGTTAYFAYQYPVRTLVLGNDVYDNTLDNMHRCQIWATLGGAYRGNDAIVDIVVDPSLCDNLWFIDELGKAEKRVLPMPSNYYQLLDNKIPYKNDVRGYVEVQFTDAFFNDPKAIANTYVIPLLMTNVNGIDHILTGTPRKGLNPSRTNLEDWDVLAKDYVLYCVKYMNPWQAKYIRRGVDIVTKNGVSNTVVRKDFTLVNTDPEYYKENPVNQYDEVCAIYTKNMKQAIFPVSFNNSGASISCNLTLTFNGNQCTISSDDENVTSTGSGEFITKGTERPEYKDYQWGSNNGQPVQRDILRLVYTVSFDNRNIYVSTTDTLVVQTRESNLKEFFETKYIKQ